MFHRRVVYSYSVQPTRLIDQLDGTIFEIKSLKGLIDETLVHERCLLFKTGVEM